LAVVDQLLCPPDASPRPRFVRRLAVTGGGVEGEEGVGKARDREG